KTASDHTLYAHWAKKKYKVTFDSNGGNAVSPASKEVTYNGTYGTLPAPTKTGHTFLGWYTSKTGGTKITAETKVTITTNQTLYAQWSINKYKVTFDATGGVCTPVSKDVVSGNVYDTLPVPTRQDYTFLGWYTSKTGGTKITSETKVTITANQNLYARWTPSKPIWDAYDFKGAGTADDPYQISSADELKELSKLVNNAYYNKVYGSAYYIQTKDIDLDNEEWIPIGYASESDKTTYNGDRLFKGFYDGQFHSVLNLNITDKFKYTGLFGRLSGGKIQNLKVEGKVNTTKNFVGGICGEITSNGIIEKCSFSGSVSGNNHVGGIVGKIYISGTVKNSNALADVSGSDYGTGGCVGLIEMGGTIENVYHIGTVKNSVHLSTGGVLGRSMLSTTQPNDNIIIQNAYHIGEVTAAEGTVGCVGEIVGYAEDKDYTFILNCYCAKDANPGFNGSVAKADIQEISLNLIRFIAEDLGKPFVTNTNKDNNNGYPVFEWQIDEQTPVEPETVHGSGDVNNDGKTDLTDLTYLSLYLLGDVDFTQQQLKTIDINKDNKVDIADLPTLKMVIMKS
ncbi:MAG: hypothetical protein E7510_06305, partial [Ruminococcus sp.]|nr:hypothetical protein [Ruminococcus sp.]